MPVASRVRFGARTVAPLGVQAPGALLRGEQLLRRAVAEDAGERGVDGDELAVAARDRNADEGAFEKRAVIGLGSRHCPSVARW